MDSIPSKVTRFFNSPNSSRHTVALVSTQPLTEMRTKNLSEKDKALPARNADNLTAICEPIVQNMW
jgi:hypothetical protein